MRVLGVDARGRPPFWSVHVTDGEVERIEAMEELEAVIAAGHEVDVLALDVPIGHEDPTGEASGLRACDEAARRLLGPHAERLFCLPPPAAFDEGTYHDALEACREHGWPKLEAPLWFARERLERLAHVAERKEGIHEVHPEASFALMRGLEGAKPRAPDAYGATWASMHERLQLLHAGGLHPEGHLEELEEAHPRQALDACAAAWSAHRIATGQARSFPEEAPIDPRTGRPVAIQG